MFVHIITLLFRSGVGGPTTSLTLGLGCGDVCVMLTSFIQSSKVCMNVSQVAVSNVVASFNLCKQGQSLIINGEVMT